MSFGGRRTMLVVAPRWSIYGLVSAVIRHCPFDMGVLETETYVSVFDMVSVFRRSAVHVHEAWTLLCTIYNKSTCPIASMTRITEDVLPAPEYPYSSCVHPPRHLCRQAKQGVARSMAACADSPKNKIVPKTMPG